MDTKTEIINADLSKAEAKAMETLTKLDKNPSVDLIISAPDGGILGTFSCGVNPPLAKILATASQSEDQRNPVGRQTERTLMPLGQDFYEVSKDYVVSIRGTFFPFRSMEDIELLIRSMPDTALYTFAVSY